MRLLPLACLVIMVLAGCVSQAAIDERYASKMDRWKAENPGLMPDDNIKASLYREAVKEIEEEVKKKREEALSHGLGAISSIASGNWAAGLFHLIGLGGLGLSAVGLRKGGAK